MELARQTNRRWRVLRRTALVLTGLGILSAASVGSALAAAKSGGDRPTSLYLALPGSDGFGISVYGDESGHHGRGTVTVGAFRQRRGVIEFAEYSAPGTVTDRTMRADLGRIGRIAVAFRGPGEPRHVSVATHGGCEGPRRVVSTDVGVFAGDVDFHGERGFTTAEAHQARGLAGNSLFRPFIFQSPLARDPLSTVSLLGCEGASASRAVPAGVPTAVVLRARSAAISFLADTIAPERSAGSGLTRPSFSSTITERRARLQITRVVAVRGSTASFDFDPALSEAAVEPPKPFTGSAEFARSVGASEWAGTLRAAFPGTGPVALTTPAFRADLSRDGTASKPSPLSPAL